MQILVSCLYGILDSEIGHSDLPITLDLPTPGVSWEGVLSSGAIYSDVFLTNFIFIKSVLHP